MSFRSRVAPALLGAAVSAVAWFLSGLALSAVASVSNRWEAAFALVFPPTVPVDTWLQLSPWNLAIPALGALLFGALSGLGYGLLLGWRRWRSAPLGLMLLGGWGASVAAAFITAAVWALGNTIAYSSPTGFSWAFRSAQPALLASGYFGVIWGWLPALIVAIYLTGRVRRLADSRAEIVTDPAAGSEASMARPTEVGSPAGRPRTWSPWLFGLTVLVTCAVGIGLVVAQPEAVRAGRIAAGGNPNGVPAFTPTPTPIPVAAPPRIAPMPVTPGRGWCVPEQTSLTATATQGALGHRALTLILINRSASSCVLDGYPDLAFADAGDHALAVTVVHGGSYTARDPGAAVVTLPTGGSAEAHLGWNATGATTQTARTLWAAQYAGAQRSGLPIDTDLTGDSTVSVTAWALPAPTG